MPAAMFVVIHHAEQIRLSNDLSNLKEYSFAQNGSLAVDFFFVLSGFLITYLLLRERDNPKTISIKNFYIRRILRIWLLYNSLVPMVLNTLGKALLDETSNLGAEYSTDGLHLTPKAYTELAKQLQPYVN